MTSTALDERAEEIASLRETIRDVCTSLGGTAVVRRLADDGPGYDAEAWDAVGVQVGAAALGLPDEADGVGGLAEVVAVAEELGRVLLPVPFLSSTVLTGQVLARCDADIARAATARLAAGEVGAFAGLSPDGWWQGDAVPVTATDKGDGWALDGVVHHVLDGAGAALFAVAAATSEGPDLFLVDGAVGGVRTKRVPTIDLARAQATLTLDAAPATRLTSGGSAAQVVEPALDMTAVALAAEQFGGALACLEMTVAYVKERRQFARPIGAFQAIKHQCADLLVLVECCRSAVVRAVECADAPDALREAAAVAQAWCSDAYRTVTAETVQLHGGIGFTWEHDAHLYFRRARADAVLLGGSSYHRERIATVLGW